MKAKRDITYCYGANCKYTEDCFRFVGKYEFDKDELYSFTAGNVDDFKCIEERK